MFLIIKLYLLDSVSHLYIAYSRETDSKLVPAFQRSKHQEGSPCEATRP